jgi:hypothetical protein
LSLLRERLHLGELRIQRLEVLLQEHEEVWIAQYLELARRAIERTYPFREATIVLGRRNAREDELFALFGNAVEVDEGPDNREQQRHRHDGESDQDQAVKRSWASGLQK